VQEIAIRGMEMKINSIVTSGHCDGESSATSVAPSRSSRSNPSWFDRNDAAARPANDPKLGVAVSELVVPYVG
jgi:hypothetical protein